MLTRTSGLDSGIQSEQVCLAGYFLNDENLVRDLLHGLHGLGNSTATLFSIRGSLVGHLVGGLRIIGILLNT